MGTRKRLRRAGWWHAGVHDPESVAEHSLRAAQLASLIAAQEGTDRRTPRDGTNRATGLPCRAMMISSPAPPSRRAVTTS